MKKLFLCCILLAAALAGCKSILDVTPQSSITDENYFSTEGDFEPYVIGIYPFMRHFANNVTYGTERGEELVPALNSRFSTAWNHVVSPTSGAVNYNDWYKAIGNCNLLLAKIEPFAFASNPDLRKKILAETYSLRAYFYFLLVQNFGGVPLKLESSKSAVDVHIERASVKQVYDQIVKDMTEAEGLVQDISAIGFGGRVSKSAVRGILMRVNLYMAGYPLKETARYDEVIKWGDKLMADAQAGHALNPSFPNIFITMAQEKYDIKESIWEAEFSGNGTDIYVETGRNGWINGIRTTNTNTGRSDGYMCYTAKLYNCYEPGDARKYWCIPHFNYADLPAASGTKTLIGEITSEATKYARYPGKFRREYETLIPKMATRSPDQCSAAALYRCAADVCGSHERTERPECRCMEQDHPRAPRTCEVYGRRRH